MELVKFDTGMAIDRDSKVQPQEAQRRSIRAQGYPQLRPRGRNNFRVLNLELQEEAVKPKPESERSKRLAAISQACAPLACEVNSSELILVRAFVRVCEAFQLQDTAFALVPPRIGMNEAVNLAATALIHLFPGGQGYGSDLATTQRYTNAIVCLRKSMESESWRQSDAALLTIFLLAFYEHKVSSQGQEFGEVHRKGMCSVLLAQAANRKGPDKELLRSLFHQAFNTGFVNPCIRGAASPLDSPDILDLEPPDHFNLPKELQMLRKKAIQLLIRLPGLIATVRSLGHTPPESKTSEAMLEASNTANELFAFKDDEGENASLHRVRIIQNLSGSSPVRCSFQYAQFSEFKTTVMYWAARILVCRICLRLIRLGVLQEGLECSESTLRAENQRSATNLMMAWNYGQAYGAFHGEKVLLPGLVAMFGVLTDYDTFRGMPSAKVRSWILSKICDSGTGADRFYCVTEAELDAASDAFVGGPVAGLNIPALNTFFGV